MLITPESSFIEFPVRMLNAAPFNFSESPVLISIPPASLRAFPVVIFIFPDFAASPEIISIFPLFPSLDTPDSIFIFPVDAY